MFDQLGTFLTASDWWAYVARIGGFYLLAWLVHRLTRRMAGRLVRLSRFTPRVRRLRPGRQATLQSLIGSAIHQLCRFRYARAGNTQVPIRLT